jgi:hypothetical protein
MTKIQFTMGPRISQRGKAWQNKARSIRRVGAVFLWWVGRKVFRRDFDDPGEEGIGEDTEERSRQNGVGQLGGDQSRTQGHGRKEEGKFADL